MTRLSTQREREPFTDSVDGAVVDPPIGAGAGVRSAECWLRNIAGVALLALATHTAPAAAIALALLSAASVTGRAPIATAAATAIAAAWSAVAGEPLAAALLLVAIAALRLRLHVGAAGGWLRRVRDLEWRRAHALVATGLARSRRSETGDAALAAAGDHYEQEGAARAALAALGAVSSPWLAPLANAAERLGRVLAKAPRLRDAIERAAAHRAARL